MQASIELGAAIAQHFDQTFRLVNHVRTAKTDRFFRVVTGEMHPLGNLAIISPEATPQDVEEAISELRSDQFPAAVVFHQQPSLTVNEVLRDTKFESHGAMPAMSVELDKLAETQLPEGYRFERVAKDQSDAWTDALARGYELPLPLSALFSPESLDADPAPDADMQWFAIYNGDEIVAVSVSVLKAGLAGIYCVATLPEERGKGLGAHVTAEPLRLAKRLGYTTGILQSSEMGYPVYQRLGFVTQGEGLPLYARMPG